MMFTIDNKTSMHAVHVDVNRRFDSLQHLITHDEYTCVHLLFSVHIRAVKHRLITGSWPVVHVNTLVSGGKLSIPNTMGNTAPQTGCNCYNSKMQ